MRRAFVLLPLLAACTPMPSDVALSRCGADAQQDLVGLVVFEPERLETSLGTRHDDVRVATVPRGGGITARDPDRLLVLLEPGGEVIGVTCG